MKLHAIIPFTVRRASEEVSQEFNQPLGVIEVLDEDGDRILFASSEDDAQDQLLGLFQSNGFYGVSFATETRKPAF